MVLAAWAWLGSRWVRVLLGLVLALNLYLLIESMRGALRAVEPPPLGVGTVVAVMFATTLIPFLIPQFHYYLDSKADRRID